MERDVARALNALRVRILRVERLLGAESYLQLNPEPKKGRGVKPDEKRYADVKRMHADGLTYVQMAAKIGISRQAVRSIAIRAGLISNTRPAMPLGRPTKAMKSLEKP